MKNCTGCKFAEWKRTKAGKLHPSSDGRCKCIVSVPALPAAFSWSFMLKPTYVGGYINRRKDHNDHCAYYQRGEA